MKRRTLLKVAALWPLLPVGVLHAEGVERRRLRFIFTIANPTQEALGRQLIWAYLPVGRTPCQRLSLVEVRASHRLLHDALDHTILEVTQEQLPALATRLVPVRLELEMRAEPDAWELTDAERWLAPERYIESDHPEIRALALELRGASAWLTGRAIFDWVSGRIEYAGYVAEDRGALDALRRRRGDCTEYAYLVAALARASGIPARAVGGYVVAGSATPRPQEFHDWAELYIDGTWRLVDAQKKNWLAPADHYVAFRIYREALDNPVGQDHRFRVAGEARVSL